MSFFQNIPERIRIILALCASVFILICLGVYSNFMAVKLKRSTQDVNNSGVIIAKIQDFTNAINDLQFSLKDFLITNDSANLNSYYINERILKLRAKELKTLRLDSARATSVNSLLGLADAQANVYNKIISGSATETDSSANRRLSARLKYEMTVLLNEQKRIQDEKFRKENTNFKRLTSIVIISSIIAIIVILFTMIYLFGIYKRLNLTKLLLLKSQERLESLIEEIPVGIVIANVFKNKFHANKKAVELLQSNITIDGTLESLDNFKQGGEGHLLNLLQLVDAIKGEKRIGLESFITVNNNKIPVRVSAIPIYHENKIEYAISVFDDITDIKNAEEDLLHAKKLIEESLVLKETFLANMSHEIRTPMNAILGFTELLRKRNLGEVENEYVSTINAAGENLLRIIDDILDFSKLNANMMTFEEAQTDVREIINNICALYDQKAVNKGIGLTYNHDNSIPQKVLTDPVRLNQVITNIVSNAIKFTEKGSVKISSKILEEDADNVTIKFSIEDTGIGIPEKKMKGVFTRFEQVLENGTHGGTGLGLSIAKHIVELRGGKISVESEVGKGSIFSFYMPFKKLSEDYKKGDHHKITREKKITLKNLRILIVEDNNYNIKLLKGIFLNQDIFADIAEDGKTALDKLKEKQYDIILLDIELPDTNGYKLASKIRNELNLTTPIIALTAHALAGEKEKCLALGMNDYLTKPVKSDLLIEKISMQTGNDFSQNSVQANGQTPDLLQKIISLDYLKSISENNREFEEEMIQIFVQKASEYSGELKIAMVHDDYKTTASIAHNLKSILSILIKEDLLPKLGLIESEAKNQELSNHSFENYNYVAGVIKGAIQEAKELLESCYSLVK